MEDPQAGAVHDPEALRALSREVLERAGTPADIAAAVADHLVDASLAGHESHGMIRLPTYVRAIRAGEVIPDARAEIVSDRGATVLVTGNWGFGQATGREAMRLAAERALRHGIAAVGLTRCTHLGRLGAYAEQAAAAGCVGLAWVGGIGGDHQAVPFGGTRPAFGTNPIAGGVPLPEGDPFVLDFATTAVARGKVMVAFDRGERLPPGCLVDREGRPTTDPADLLTGGGAFLPFGGHKGSALALLAELLGQALVGGELHGEEGRGGIFAGTGALFVAMDAGAFRPAGDAVGRAGEIVDAIRANPPAPGVDRVLAPGDLEAGSRARGLREGIALPPATARGIRETAEALGIDVARYGW